MTKFESDKVVVKAACEEVYEFLADFNNFEKLLPSKISDWQSTSDSCSFKIDSIGKLSMRIDSKKQGRYINIVSDGENPVEYTLDCYFYKYGTEQCEVVIEFNAELSPFIKAIAARPLQNFVNTLADKIKELYDRH